MAQALGRRESAPSGADKIFLIDKKNPDFFFFGEGGISKLDQVFNIFNRSSF